VLIVQPTTPTATDSATFRVQKTTTFTAANSSFVNSLITAEVNVGSADQTNEWAITGVCRTNDAPVAPATGGSCVGVYGQGNRNVGSTDYIWGGVMEAIDRTDVKSSTSQGEVGLEVKIQANKADDANPDQYGPTGNRIVVNLVGASFNATDPADTEIASGMRLSYGNSNVYFDTGYAVGLTTPVRIAFDSRGANSVPGATRAPTALAMSAGQNIEFDALWPGNGAYTDTTPQRTLVYNNFPGRLEYDIGATAKWWIDDTGLMNANQANVSGTLTVGGNIVVGQATYGLLGPTGTRGALKFCINCLKPGETTGHGTGMLVFDDGNSHWVSTAGTVAAN
jgi:hypothetical protein